MASTTRRFGLSFPLRASLLVAAIGATSACSHDWDALDPTGAASATSSTTTASTSATTTGSGGGGAGGGAAGTGGAGIGGEGGLGGGGGGTGGLGDGDCPTMLAGPALVKVTAVGGGAHCVDATEVTNVDYDAWLATSPATNTQAAYCAWNTDFHPPGWPPPASDKLLPIVSVDWCDAVAYCGGIGKRLCGRIGGGAVDDEKTADAAESAWFDACSAGGDLLYPYGDTYQLQACNGGDLGLGKPLDAGSSAACEGGEKQLFDMSGNVWEWENACVAYGDASDTCAVRGGDYSAKPEAMTCASKAGVKRSGGGANIGFRCCADALP